MQILYSVNNGGGSLLYTKQKPDKNIVQSIVDKFPSVLPDLPVYVSGTVESNGAEYAYKAISIRQADGQSSYIHAYVYDAAGKHSPFDRMRYDRFFTSEDISSIVSGGIDYSEFRPSVISGCADISPAALKYALTAVYENRHALITLPADLASSAPSLDCIAVLLRSYFDRITACSTALYFNTLSGYDDRTGVTFVSENKGDLPCEHVSLLCEYADTGDGEASKAAEYTANSALPEREEFIELLDKYGKYCEGDGTVSHCVTVYEAFIEFDEQLIYDLVHKYSTDVYRQGGTPDIDAGTKTLLRRYVRDGSVINSIYSGCAGRSFEELIAGNKCETEFFSLFRGTGSIFESDDAESCNVMLAARIAEDKEGREKSDAFRDELDLLDSLAENAENRFELGMIMSYRKVIESQVRESEFLNDIRNRVLNGITGYISACDGDSLFSDATDIAIHDICEREGADRRDYLDDIESIKTARYREILTADVEKSFDTVGKPESTLEKLYGYEFAAAQDEPDNGDSEEIRALTEAIAGMTASDYKSVIAGVSDYCSGQNADPSAVEMLNRLCKKALGGIFDTYSSYRSALSGVIRSENESVAKLIAESSYSYAYCYALESCDVNSISEIVQGFDRQKVDNAIFYQMFYRKIWDLSRELASFVFAEELEKLTSDETLLALLLAAKIATCEDTGYKVSAADIDKLADVYPTVTAYIAGEICVDLAADGVFFSKIPMSVYSAAKADPAGNKVRSAAEKSREINDFLAYMGVEGYTVREQDPPETKKEETPVVEDPAFEEYLNSLFTQEKSGDDVQELGESETSGHSAKDGGEAAPDAESKDDSGISAEDVINVEVRRDDDFESPAVLNIITKKKNGETLKAGIIAASILTALAAAAFIIIMILMK